MDKNEYLSVIEGMLYIYGDEGVTIKDVAEALEITKKEAYELMDELLSLYASKTVKGVDICDFGGTYKMVTLPQHDVYYKKMMTTSGRKLSKSALETLAIVAYYQPVTRIRIEEIRGVGCESMIRKLLAQALIKEVGRDDSPGKPVLYGVTDEFMDAFNLKSLDELPELKEIESEFDEEDIFNTKYQEKVEEYKNLGYNEGDAKIEAGKWVAVPGTSEHCLGYAADLCSLEENFENSDQFAWLQKHCAEYGFILRYPKDKVDITKISYEPWHYRYVGSNHAQIIMSQGLCLEEYLEQLEL